MVFFFIYSLIRSRKVQILILKWKGSCEEWLPATQLPTPRLIVGGGAGALHHGKTTDVDFDAEFDVDVDVDGRSCAKT